MVRHFLARFIKFNRCLGSIVPLSPFLSLRARFGSLCLDSGLPNDEAAFQVLVRTTTGLPPVRVEVPRRWDRVSHHPPIIDCLTIGHDSIVVVPGLWAQGCPKDEEKSCSWLKLLLASTDQDTRVFIFTYDIDPTGAEDGHVWHQLLLFGNNLLDTIRQARPFEVRAPETLITQLIVTCLFVV